MATKKCFRVKAGAVVVVVDGAERYLYRGARLPDGVSTDDVKRLKGVGLIEAVEVEVAENQPTKPAGNAGFDRHLEWARHVGIEVPAEVVDVKDRDAVKALVEAHEAAK